MTKPWFYESLHAGYAQGFAQDQIIFEAQSEHQQITIFENAIFGRVLTLDGVVQTTERDEFIYHEMLAHVPLLAHASPEHVLIVGGGDGGLLREVLKHPTVKAVTMVEIDGRVVEMCKTYLPQHSQGAFEDPRLRLEIADGLAFMRNCQDSFDVILSDSTDPIGPGEVLFSQDFYALCHQRLNPGGILVTQNGVSLLQMDEIMTTAKRIAGSFTNNGFYAAAVPSYVGGNMHYAWACEDTDLKQTSPRPIDFATQYYDAEVHQAAFALPYYVKQAIGE